MKLTGSVGYLLASPSLAAVDVRLPLHLVPAAAMAVAIADVVSVESPVHLEEVARRIARSAGVRRVGWRILERVSSAVSLCIKGGRVVQRGNFLWRPDMDEPQVAIGQIRDGPLKQIDRIAPEEVAQAVLLAVAQCRASDPEDLVVPASRLLGIGGQDWLCAAPFFLR